MYSLSATESEAKSDLRLALLPRRLVSLCAGRLLIRLDFGELIRIAHGRDEVDSCSLDIVDGNPQGFPEEPANI